MTAIDSAAAAALDLSVLQGDWRNTNEQGTLGRIVCEAAGGKLTVRTYVRGQDWGTVDAPVFAFEFDSKQAGAFYALYDRDNQELRLQANVKAGVLVVVTLFRFPDATTGRSNYFNREFFYRIPA